MRALERKFTGDISNPYIWTPVFIQFGSNIKGRRLKKGSVLFEPNEIEKALTSHPDSVHRLLGWLSDLECTYTKETQ